MTETKNNIKALNWVIITAVGFVLFLALAIVFSLYSAQLNLINSSTYFFLLVAMALLAAGFLFGALRSHAAYKGKAYNGTLELSGPVVVLALVILLGYKFRPVEAAFGLTINVFSNDGAHAPVEAGELSFYYGSAKLTKAINNGQVVIPEVPKAFRGKEATVLVKAEGFCSNAMKVVVPATENTMSLNVDRIPDSVIVSGIVLTPKGAAVSGAMVVFADGLIKATTDELGNFKTVLPFKDGAETTVRVYRNGSIKYNNLVRLSNQGTLTIQLR